MSSAPSCVALIGAGGTMAMHGRNPFDWVDYADSGIITSIESVVSDVGLCVPGIELEFFEFRLLASTAIGWTEWCELARLVGRLREDRSDLSGIVITHGTASLEETAWFLNLVLTPGIPVVVVGAQRPPNTAASDVPANLRAAFQVAADPAARGVGTLVVMNQYVFCARDVSKASNFNLDAFQSQEFGPLARVEADGSVRWRRLPARPPRMVRPYHTLKAPELPRVDIAFSYAGADGVAIRAFVAAGAQGLISMGLPPGRCTPEERRALLGAVEAGVIVVQASRAPSGTVPLQRYNQVDGILSGGDLAANKLRILVSLGMSQDRDRERLQELILIA